MSWDQVKIADEMARLKVENRELREARDALATAVQRTIKEVLGDHTAARFEAVLDAHARGWRTR